jgi:hypothetical protein
MPTDKKLLLDSGDHKTNVDFERHLGAVRPSLLDGHLNDAEDWPKWTYSLIVREEQRVIGECMVDPDKRSIIGYGAFHDKFIATRGGSSRWIGLATSFLLDLRSVPDAMAQDVRGARCPLLTTHGVSLIECLNKDRIEDRLVGFRVRAERTRQYACYQAHMRPDSIARCKPAIPAVGWQRFIGCYPKLRCFCWAGGTCSGRNRTPIGCQGVSRRHWIRRSERAGMPKRNCPHLTRYRAPGGDGIKRLTCVKGRLPCLRAKKRHLRLYAKASNSI